jgi:hypothetical protein
VAGSSPVSIPLRRMPPRSRRRLRPPRACQVVELSRRLAAGCGFGSIQFHHATIHSLDVESSIRFDRIWVGAGASVADVDLILQLLRVGGIAVGPFEDVRQLESTRRVASAGIKNKGPRQLEPKPQGRVSWNLGGSPDLGQLHRAVPIKATGSARRI